VFCSGDVFKREMADAAERALYAEHVSQAILRRRMDVEAGNCVEGIDAAKSAVALRHSPGLSDHGQVDTHQPLFGRCRASTYMESSLNVE